MNNSNEPGEAASKQWDTQSHPAFFEYYAQQSLSEETLRRDMGIMEAVLLVLGHPARSLCVADIGCGAGAQCPLWYERGHRIFGVDVNEPLIQLARARAVAAGVEARFEVASATQLPWDDGVMDVCLMPELLEHVADWKTCLEESARVLKPGGVLYASTTNKLCPVQQEFELPLYSWYPGFLKRRYERLAVTTRPELVNHAKYPAVNWFSFYTLRASLDALGFDCLDRFDLAALRPDKEKGALLAMVRKVFLLRFFAQVATPYTTIVAIKRT